MVDDVIAELLEARRARRPCVLATVAETRGSAPREAGSKMLVFPDGSIRGTVGGGKFEALVVEASLAALRQGGARLERFTLREGEPGSFGAICGGEVAVLIEPQSLSAALVLVGAGHCSRAIARLARDCGFFVTVIDDRDDLASAERFPWADERVTDRSAAEVFAARRWQAGDAIVMVSRNHEIDREALRAALAVQEAGYIGMIGSRRKVRQVFERLRADGVEPEALERVYAPLGLDIGADAPAEIAVSVIGELLAVLRGRPGGHLRIRGSTEPGSDSLPLRIGADGAT